MGFLFFHVSSNPFTSSGHDPILIGFLFYSSYANPVNGESTITHYMKIIIWYEFWKLDVVVSVWAWFHPEEYLHNRYVGSFVMVDYRLQ